MLSVTNKFKIFFLDNRYLCNLLTCDIHTNTFLCGRFKKTFPKPKHKSSRLNKNIQAAEFDLEQENEDPEELNLMNLDSFYDAHIR